MAKLINKLWTDADDAELVLMREARTPTKEIAIALGRTPSAVMNRISAKGIPYGKLYTKEQLEGFSQTKARGLEELTFREVVDTAFAKHEIEFGAPDRKSEDLERSKPKADTYGFGRLPEMLNQMERDIKRKPQWLKAMMWWRK
jgi:predicted transcriptional regulator